ncbi:MAG: HlyD family efflux transporter periplasmic adaptor subunit, partial [Pseudomonadota bacterium]
MTLHRGGDDAPSGDEAKTARRREMNSALLRGVFQLALVVAFVGGAAFAVRWLMDTRPSAPQQAVAEPVYAVRATKAQAAVNQPSINVFGEVSARRSVELRALVAGKTAYVSEKLIVGQAVGAGDLLVSIDDFSYRGAMVEARANLAEATARLAEAEAQLAANEKDLERVREQVALAERDLTRARELGRRNTLSERTIDERELTLVQRRQQLEAAESAKTIQEARILQQSATMERLAWRVEQAERDLEDTALRAPFDAVVRSENVGLGKRLGVNDVVAQLYQADVLDVQFTLSDSQFGRLSSGAAPLLDR